MSHGFLKFRHLFHRLKSFQVDCWQESSWKFSFWKKESGKIMLFLFTQHFFIINDMSKQFWVCYGEGQVLNFKNMLWAPEDRCTASGVFGGNGLNRIFNPNESEVDMIRNKKRFRSIRARIVNLIRIHSDWVSTDLYRTRFKAFFRLVRNDSERNFGIAQNSSNSLGLNFNSKFSPGHLTRSADAIWN